MRKETEIRNNRKTTTLPANEEITIKVKKSNGNQKRPNLFTNFLSKLTRNRDPNQPGQVNAKNQAKVAGVNADQSQLD